MLLSPRLREQNPPLGLRALELSLLQDLQVLFVPNRLDVAFMVDLSDQSGIRWCASADA